MIRPRVIPALLLKGQGLVKTVKFKDPKELEAEVKRQEEEVRFL